jgi:hypothetical protein
MRTRRYLWLAACLAVALVAAVGASRAMTFGDTNLVDLVKYSQAIVTGTVETVAEGIDERGIPYTEVTIHVEQSIKGGLSGNHTFRQFGLTSPRPMGDGRIMMPAPEGIPRYVVGERTLLFLSTPARATGLQSTYGLAAGKFILGAGRAENGFSNEGTFARVGIADGLATDNDLRMLATEKGAVSEATLLQFVRRAVDENWTGRNLLWKDGQRQPNLSPPTRPAIVDDPSASDTGTAGSRTRTTTVGKTPVAK